jgi:phosphatidylethanolamine-binding protein (PEBP) family uncharacterized protein
VHPIESMLAPLGRRWLARRPDPALSIANRPELQTSRTIALTSPSYAEGGEIPARHCGWLIGDEISPALAWSGLPDGTRDLLLVFEDTDVPRATPTIHTAALFSPGPGDAGGLTEGALARGASGIRFVPRSGYRAKYVGPRPFPGHGPHHYGFHLYALDAIVDTSSTSRAADLPVALAGHVLASGSLTGWRQA